MLSIRGNYAQYHNMVLNYKKICTKCSVLFNINYDNLVVLNRFFKKCLHLFIFEMRSLCYIISKKPFLVAWINLKCHSKVKREVWNPWGICMRMRNLQTWRSKGPDSKSVIHRTLISSTTQRIFPLQSTSQGLVLLFVTSGNTKGSSV